VVVLADLAAVPVGHNKGAERTGHKVGKRHMEKDSQPVAKRI
jgi:hypothetical protein